MGQDGVCELVFKISVRLRSALGTLGSYESAARWRLFLLNQMFQKTLCSVLRILVGNFETNSIKWDPK